MLQTLRGSNYSVNLPSIMMAAQQSVAAHALGMDQDMMAKVNSLLPILKESVTVRTFIYWEGINKLFSGLFFICELTQFALIKNSLSSGSLKV